MALTTIRTRLKTLIEGVADIGKVYDYFRFPKDSKEDAFKALFVTEDSILLAWQFMRVSSGEAEQSQDSVNKQNIRQHRFHIWGIMGVEDTAATAKTFQDLIEAVCSGIRDASNSPSPWDGDALKIFPPQVRIVEHREVSGYLVHSVDLFVEIQEIVEG